MKVPITMSSLRTIFYLWFCWLVEKEPSLKSVFSGLGRDHSLKRIQYSFFCRCIKASTWELEQLWFFCLQKAFNLCSILYRAHRPSSLLVHWTREAEPRPNLRLAEQTNKSWRVSTANDWNLSKRNCRLISLTSNPQIN